MVLAYLLPIMAPMIAIFLMVPSSYRGKRSRESSSSSRRSGSPHAQDQTAQDQTAQDQTAQDQRLKCASCSKELPPGVSWDNWVFLGPGKKTAGTGTKDGRYYIKELVTKRLEIYINLEDAYCGKHGTYCLFCKSCMQTLSEDIQTKHGFKGWINCDRLVENNANPTEEERTRADAADWRNLETAFFASFIVKSFRDKIPSAKESVQDEKSIGDLTEKLEQSSIIPGDTGGLGEDRNHATSDDTDMLGDDSHAFGPAQRPTSPEKKQRPSDTSHDAAIDEDEL